MPPNIFVSYSHADTSLVAPIVVLLRVSKALVFLDSDSIPPGKRWRDELGTAISEASVVVVFWCHHAKTSREVEKEFKAAIALGKDVLPLLLDETPLPTDLADFQYIDFREIFGTGHAVVPTLSISPPLRATQSSPVRLVALMVMVVFGMAGIISSFLFMKGAPPILVPPPNSGGAEFSSGLLFSGLALFIVLLNRWLKRIREKSHDRRESLQRESCKLPISDMQTLIAKTIEVELIRRIGASTIY